jgi:hypothetical protein
LPGWAWLAFRWRDAAATIRGIGRPRPGIRHICGSFRGETDDSAYIWIRRFESEAERVALYAAVYETEYWKNQIAPRVPLCLDRPNNVVTRIVPTPKSTVQ